MYGADVYAAAIPGSVVPGFAIAAVVIPGFAQNVPRFLSLCTDQPVLSLQPLSR